jgi:hypothetical protein
VSNLYTVSQASLQLTLEPHFSHTGVFLALSADVDREAREKTLKKAILVTFVLAAANIPFIVVSIRPTVSSAIAEQQMAQLWREPDQIATADLFNGPWPDLAPDPNAIYAFGKPKLHGNSPGLTIRDPKGVEWSVKQGREASVEVALSRVLSAIGYRQPPVFFLPAFTLQRDGAVERAPAGRFRAKLDSMREMGDWSWQQNPFVGTRPYQGLLVALVIFNSSDLKDSNNTVYEMVPPRDGAPRWYVVRDIGSGLGETAKLDAREGDPNLFDRLGFINGVKDGFVEFSYHGWHQELFTKRITPDDVRWTCEHLAKLSDAQWRDAFRAGGFDQATADRFIRRLKAKIDEGRQLTNDQ